MGLCRQERNRPHIFKAPACVRVVKVEAITKNRSEMRRVCHDVACYPTCSGCKENLRPVERGTSCLKREKVGCRGFFFFVSVLVLVTCAYNV